MKIRLAHFQNSNQSGFTLIEMLIVVAIIGVLSVVAIGSYQVQIRKTHFTTIYQEMNHFRMPYQILVDEGAGVTEFSPNGLNMAAQTKYCHFSVTAPNSNSATLNAVACTIQKLNYVEDETISLDRAIDGTWQCRASSGISKSYLPLACH